jgi:hypothetical protein
MNYSTASPFVDVDRAEYVFRRDSSVFPKIDDVFSRRRFATKHHGQIKSEVTSTTRSSAGGAILFATFSIMSETPIFMVQSSD